MSEAAPVSQLSNSDKAEAASKPKNRKVKTVLGLTVIDGVLQRKTPRQYVLGKGSARIQENGVCAETDPEAFFPEKGESTKEAKKVCRSCDIREDCLEIALDTKQRFGVWGGFSEPERRKIAKAVVGFAEA